MMADNLIFLTNQQREELKKAYAIVDHVKGSISIDHEEYSIIKTTLSNIKKAIEYEKKYY